MSQNHSAAAPTRTGDSLSVLPERIAMRAIAESKRVVGTIGLSEPDASYRDHPNVRYVVLCIPAGRFQHFRVTPRASWTTVRDSQHRLVTFLSYTRMAPDR